MCDIRRWEGFELWEVVHDGMVFHEEMYFVHGRMKVRSGCANPIDDFARLWDELDPQRRGIPLARELDEDYAMVVLDKSVNYQNRIQSLRIPSSTCSHHVRGLCRDLVHRS
jgi:hypothetical protein